MLSEQEELYTSSSEEQLWETLQICRILSNRDQSHKDRLNQLLSQVFQNEPDQNSQTIEV